MKIFVKVLQSDSIPFDVRNSDTVFAFKISIHQKSGIPVDDQRLIFSGKHLEDDTLSLSEYGIHEDAIIHLIRRVR